MIAIKRTVNIAADRRLRLDMEIPETVPSGRTSIVLVFPTGKELPRPYTPEPSPSIEELKAKATAKYAEMLETGIDPLAKYAGCLKGVYPEDAVKYQRELRDEWPD